MALREPCPVRIMEEVGGAFATGCVGGSLCYMVRGFINSPAKERIRGALTATKFRGPMIGGSFAMWGGIFSITDCLLRAVRQDDSSFNSLLAGYVTTVVMFYHGGVTTAWRSGIVGALAFGLMCGGFCVCGVIWAYEETQNLPSLPSKFIRKEMSLSPYMLRRLAKRVVRGEDPPPQKPSADPS